MPVAIFNIPQLNPTKFYQLADKFITGSYGSTSYKTFNPNVNLRHLDSDFFARNIQSYFNQDKYFQPYQTGDVLSAQFLGVEEYGSPATFTYKMHIVNTCGQIVKSVTCSKRTPLLSTGAQIWYYNVPLYDVPEGKYVVLIHKPNNGSSPDFFVITEGLDIKHYHKDTVLIQYTNSKNDFGMFFEDFQMFTLRLPGHLTLTPEAEINAYDDQSRNHTMLSAVPYRSWKLTLGIGGKEIPPYMADIVNRATLCDTLYINDVLMTRAEGSKIESDAVEKSQLSEISLDLREYNNDADLVVSSYPSLYLMDAPTAEMFYIKQIKLTAAGAPVTVGRYFTSVKNFIDYLNTDYINTIALKATYFALNDLNQIVLTTDNSTVYTFYSGGWDTVTPYQGWLKLEVDASSLAGGSIYLDTSGTTNYAIFWATNTSPVTGSITGTNVTKTFTYTPGVKYDTYLFVDDTEQIDLTSMNAPVVGISGQLPASITTLYANSIGLKYVRRNLFDLVNAGVMVDINFSDNKISSNEINKLLMYLYESVAGFDSGASIDLSLQTPSAPPIGSLGVQTFINAINNTATITTD